MANDDDDKTINSTCTVCAVKFQNVQECLKHELIKHSFNNRTKPENRLQRQVNATLRFLNSEDKQCARLQLKNNLKKCSKGEELKVIFDMFCMKTDSLNLIFTRIQTCLERELRQLGIPRIYPFGSIASGLALRDCDIDIYLDASDMQKNFIKNEDYKYKQRKTFNRITNLLLRSPHFIEVFGISRARVPIIKCKHKDTGFSLDINICCPSSTENTKFVYDLTRCDERIHELMLFLKLWAKHTQIIGRDNMNSYCLITMIIFYLQQPWKQHDNHEKRILKSIKELQENESFHMVQGVNYAYNLRTKNNQPKIPTNVTTWQLIKEFFNFYKNFNFKDLIISPFYGKAVDKSNQTADICQEYYQQIRTISQYLRGEQVNNLQIDRCMCVQDAFCLNQNTAKSILPHNAQYILLCLRNAYSICENPNNLNLSDLYEHLLFETIEVNKNSKKDLGKSDVTKILKNLTLPSNDTKRTSTTNTTVNKLGFTLTPSKSETYIIASYYPELKNPEEIMRCWFQQHIDAIKTIVTKLYRMDIQKQIPGPQKQQKLDLEHKDEELNQVWSIFCSIDLWTNRCFQKPQQTSFLTYQLNQTEQLYSLRRQDPKFSVTLNGVLKLNALTKYKGMEVHLDLPEDSSSNLNKRSPCRKFFNIFKNTLQCCTFKETLNINAKTNNKNTSEEITEDENESEKQTNPEASDSLVANATNM